MGEMTIVHRSSLPGGGTFELHLDRELVSGDLKHIRRLLDVLEEALPQEIKPAKRVTAPPTEAPRTPVESPLHLLHVAWSAAVAAPGYNKEAWKLSYDRAVDEKWDTAQVNRAIEEHGRLAR